jgi:hypothetical protein
MDRRISGTLDLDGTVQLLIDPEEVPGSSVRVVKVGANGVAYVGNDGNDSVSADTGYPLERSNTKFPTATVSVNFRNIERMPPTKVFVTGVSGDTIHWLVVDRA